MMSQYSFGFVYVLTNKIMPGIVKIGITASPEEDRPISLFTMGMPDAFEVVFRAITSHPAELEKRVHEQLKEKRYRPNREFFEVTPELAASTILQARQETDGIKAWAKKSQLYLQDGDRLLLSLRAGQVLFLSAYPSLVALEAAMIDLWQVHTDGDTLELYFTDNPASLPNDEPRSPDNAGNTPDNDIVIYKEQLFPGDRLLWMDDAEPRFISALFESKCHCQLIARTRDPKFTAEGYPKLINVDASWTASSQVSAAKQYVCSLPRPRIWTARHTGTANNRADVTWKNAPPANWLPYLNPKPATRETR
ncbi:GIY-YIG nuclease family protein [Chitinophaga polysaccharea]|uniref:GIY-YIG nuclease family protein n=1 Tax=Chitinophaga TaxID=79328 RepID=UPI001455345E|nr:MULTISPECIES: GIY-YIG nuclease family protein [Chitinophaga]NLR58202.1 GIY-YIG nuclease family protein [Chitinophaga polysaccharea]NLU90726.1 GIY-YIG nuclease family protein [Chitinophaga sp. Ak27]